MLTNNLPPGVSDAGSVDYVTMDIAIGVFCMCLLLAVIDWWKDHR